jgi:DNA relaxase NicK
MSDDTPEVSPSQATIIEAQVDWLSCSFASEEKSQRAHAWAYSRARREHREGYRELPFRLMGYEGWAVGRIRFGTREDMAFLQLSGLLAEEYIAEMVAAADRVSRIDIAVTVRLPEPDQFLGESTYAQACNWRAANPTSAMPWLMQDDDGGCTAYVGHRTSDRFLRVYNKEAEAQKSEDAKGKRHYKACWRYELECKGTVALAMAREVVASSFRPQFITQQVWRFCTRHGIEPVFRSDQDAELVPGFRRRSDYQSRLSWLKRSVNPAILSMLEVGDRADIIEALGLGGPDGD